MGTSLQKVAFRAMGTECAIAVTTSPGEVEVARRALHAGVTEVATCERALSRFDGDSDLSRLNRAAGEWTLVDRRLVDALRAALDARVSTGGRFDPTILPALVAAGYDRSFELLEERAAIPPSGRCAGAVIDLDPIAGQARVERGAAVDLGGIGKGFSAASAIQAMCSAWPSVTGCLADLGGDIAVWGTPPGGGPWRIDVADPERPGGRLTMIGISAGGVATSGRNTRRFGPARRLHHLIDPMTRMPAESGPLAVTVVGRDAADAEAHATALAITPVSEASTYLRTRPHLAALLVPVDGAPTVHGDLHLVAERRQVRIDLPTPIGGRR